MITQLFKKRKDLHLQRSFSAPIATVWQAWTDADQLRQWWGPKDTTVTECEIDLRVGGAIYVVTEAGAGMGKYQGTRWPMAGTITLIAQNQRLVYEARSWTEGEQDGSTIHHTNDLTLRDADGLTVVDLHISITRIGPKAKMAAFGMKWGYKQQLDHLVRHLSVPT